MGRLPHFLFCTVLFRFNHIKHCFEGVPFGFEFVDDFAKVGVWTVGVGSVGIIHGMDKEDYAVEGILLLIFPKVLKDHLG